MYDWLKIPEPRQAEQPRNSHRVRKHVYPQFSRNNYNDIMFSHSTNHTIHGGTFQVYHHGATIGTSEAVEGSRNLMAVTQEASRIYRKQSRPAHSTILETQSIHLNVIPTPELLL
jgi:hypothetical protein